jgi:hypothetical protein
MWTKEEIEKYHCTCDDCVHRHIWNYGGGNPDDSIDDGICEVTKKMTEEEQPACVEHYMAWDE